MKRFPAIRVLGALLIAAAVALHVLNVRAARTRAQGADALRALAAMPALQLGVHGVDVVAEVAERLGGDHKARHFARRFATRRADDVAILVVPAERIHLPAQLDRDRVVLVHVYPLFPDATEWR